MIGDRGGAKILPAGFRRALRALFAPADARRGSGQRWDAQAGPATIARQGRGGGGGAGRRSRELWRVAERAARGEPDACAAIAHALPSREALILLAVINHPWLLDDACRRIGGNRVPPRGRATGCGARSMDAAPGGTRSTPGRCCRAAIARAELRRCARPGRGERSRTPRTGRRAEERGGRGRSAHWWTHVVSLASAMAGRYIRSSKTPSWRLGEEPSEENSRLAAGRSRRGFRARRHGGSDRRLWRIRRAARRELSERFAVRRPRFPASVAGTLDARGRGNWSVRRSDRVNRGLTSPAKLPARFIRVASLALPFRVADSRAAREDVMPIEDRQSTIGSRIRQASGARSRRQTEAAPAKAAAARKVGTRSIAGARRS